MKRAIVLFIALIATGCGAAPHEPQIASTDEPERDLAGYEARLGDLQRELEAAVPPAAPDGTLTHENHDLAPGASEQCNVAADLRDRICDLSTRICDIAERDPSAADTMIKCQRARDACKEARSRVASACGK